MTEITMKKERPKHLDLRAIKQPVPAIASILHRISGAGLFLMLPFLIFLFELSLDSSLGFAMAQAFVAHPLVKLVLIGLLWAFLHHFCMGVRILFLDLNIGTDLKPARASAKAVIVVSLLLTVILGVRLW
ncbi:MAG: succinate dehydrogenase, cytochrome b556 subunit [Rhodocyclaceae bacterium]|jgi:succinate dehydrogenase / fumarate reductase cytochrome b subunit|uniref:Succinate dehydrogenase cytochrome b556 subunit n=1 Tax=Candidatus Desulfobacillus denitrificans TaxID=2608985 RepID=A0A809SAS8_9PROT|nr:succinate dehydrogenase, cytochrome b556 subunit [Rhodocyclaceae bacterium]BBO21104.1 succinate dehydrogenase, cytochrome b556 subunit [Candidatus Desulfobacillus denitrificans]GIK46983.1 MAG: succinate dehydrogenase, cytochrome b556 subunit [Betaproteobacteria bacterium]GJQ53549.1 MAG: succinate dehydrogenase, cytochrome b556 subunit [Rhodocyclaceae bacterium]